MQKKEQTPIQTSIRKKQKKKTKKKQNQKQKKANYLFSLFFRFFLLCFCFFLLCFCFFFRLCFRIFFVFFSFSGDLMTGTFENVRNSWKKTKKMRKNNEKKVKNK